MWLGWFAVLLQLDDNERFLCSIPNTGDRLLLTGNRARAQTGRNNFVVRSRQSPGQCCVATSGVNTDLYVIPGSHICKIYYREQDKSLRRAFAMEQVKTSPFSGFVERRYIFSRKEISGTDLTAFGTTCA